MRQTIALNVCCVGMMLCQTAAAQSLPDSVQGRWDVSIEACNRDGTSTTQVDISAGRIVTYGGNAIVREVTETGLVTYVAADFLQLEGAAEVRPRERTFFRLTQRDSADRLNYIWKDVTEVDLVRCPQAADTFDETAGVLPLVQGYYVVAGGFCDAAANASWRTFDGEGIYGAASESCVMRVLDREGDLFVTDQTCIARHDGSEAQVRDIVRRRSKRSFLLLEDGETQAQAFEWCGAALRP